MSSRPLFYILDGHALAYRSYFAQSARPLMTASGEGTSAVFGFARTLMDILEKEQPYYLAVAFDAGLTGRDELFPEYKGTREKMPDDLESQIRRIIEIVQAFNVPILMEEGYEADDLMGTVSLMAEAQGVDVMIFTGDRDLLQLLTEHTKVRLYVPQTGVPDEFYDVQKFREKYGLEPIQLIDFKALKGDTSDNIPGVRGIGDKTATALLQQFGTLENIYANLDQIKGSTLAKLEAGRDMAFLSYRLATIQRDCPIKFDLTQCVAHDFDKRKVEALFRELEFGSLFNQLGRLSIRTSEQLPLFNMHDVEVPLHTPTVSEATKFPTVIVDDEEKLRDLVKALNNASGIAFDTEATGTDKMLADLVGISLSVDGETGYYIPVGHLDGQQLPLETVIEAIRPAMTNPNIPKYAHNADYDLVMMQRFGIDVQPIAFDTMIAEWVRDPLSQTIGLKRLALKELQVTMTEITELIGTGKKQIPMSQVPIDLAAPYAVADAVTTHRLVPILEQRLQRQPGDPDVDPLWGTENPPAPIDVFRNIEIPLIPVIAAMEQTGVLLDTAYLDLMSKDLNDRLLALEAEIYELSGTRFNINSPKQLNDVLFGTLGLKAQGIRKTSHGVSTAADVLESMRGEHPVIDKILNYRELSKLKGTYVDALPALINPRTRRVHTDFNQTGASTGRMSSSNPNLQNIPIRTEIGREVRRAFIVPDGMCLLSVDYSQVELRIMAHITREPSLLEAFAQGQDIHAVTAALVHNVPIEQVTKTQRNFAKRVNFGILYGMGAQRLARESDLTYVEAEAFIRTYFQRLPGVREYLDKAKALAKRSYLSTLFGRRRTFAGLRNATGNRNQIAQAEREAINMPIQGTAADIMKMAMVSVYNKLERHKLGAKMMLQVHDELVLEVPEKHLQETAALVVQAMEEVADLAAPLKANAQFGTNWRDLQDVRL